MTVSPFQGLSAFPVTPADAQGRVDAALMARLAERLCVSGIASIGLLGSTGTYAYLAREERRRAVAAAAEAVRGRVPLIVGVGALRTDAACDLARDAAASGADALLMAPVSYTPLTPDEVFEHYRAVAGTTGLPLCVYNNPSTTGFRFDADLLARLAAIPAVRAVKMPLPADGDVARDLAALRDRTGLLVGYSGDWGMADALLAGADAFYGVLAGLLPEPAAALARAAASGEAGEARRLDAELAPLWDLFRRHGSLRVVHALLPALGLGRAELPRPLLPLAPEAREAARLAAGCFLAREGEAGA